MKWRRFRQFLLYLIGTGLLFSCSNNKVSDKDILICLGQEGMTQSILDIFQDISLQHGYSFHDRGIAAKKEIIRINSTHTAAPKGMPAHFYIEKENNSIVLMGGNIGVEENSFLVSFFYHDQEDEMSPFYVDIVTGISSISNSRIIYRKVEDANKNLCFNGG